MFLHKLGIQQMEISVPSCCSLNIRNPNSILPSKLSVSVSNFTLKHQDDGELIVCALYALVMLVALGFGFLRSDSVHRWVGLGFAFLLGAQAAFLAPVDILVRPIQNRTLRGTMGTLEDGGEMFVYNSNRCFSYSCISPLCP